MDLDNHIHLRSFVKPDVTPLIKAILAALLIHVIFMLSWPINTNLTVAEIPQWVNIKLVAGIEETMAKKKTPIKTQEQIKDNRMIKKRIKKNLYPIKNEKIVKQIQKETSSNATTFVVANSKPYKLDNPKPVYPAAARRRGMQGTVLLSIRVNHKGYVEYIKIEKTSGFKVLDRSAVNSVEQWRFVPAQRENKFVASTVEIPIKFSLNDV